MIKAPLLTETRWACLLTNAEHRQAKDILRGALRNMKGEVDDGMD